MGAARNCLPFSTSLYMVSSALFDSDFRETVRLMHIPELSIAPNLNHQLVPPHMRPVLAAKGLDIENLQPLTKEQMLARLD